MIKRSLNNWYHLSSLFSEATCVALALGFLFSMHEELEHMVYRSCFLWVDDCRCFTLPWPLLPLKELKGDHEIVLAAVSKYGHALQYATEKLKGDSEIALAAVSDCGGALQFATEELKGDRKIVLAAVSENGHALQFATEEPKGDREIVLAAVSNGDGGALKFATEELKGDREIVLAAVSEDGCALNHATNGLRADEEMMRNALEQSRHQLVGLKVSLLSGRCCGIVFPMWNIWGDTGKRLALRSCAASLELDRDLVERIGTFVCGPIEVKDLRELKPGKVHELTLVLPWHSLACSGQ